MPKDDDKDNKKKDWPYDTPPSDEPTPDLPIQKPPTTPIVPPER